MDKKWLLDCIPIFENRKELWKTITFVEKIYIKIENILT